MDQQQQSSRRLTRRQLLWAAGGIAALVFLIIVICGYVLGWMWTGLPNKRTLWDWLQLLLVPAAIAVGGTVGGAWFARERARETALQSYLDKMSELLIDKQLHEKDKEYDPARVTARARTLVVLKQLDGKRKQSVMQFLYEVHLIDGENRRGTTPLLQAQVGLDGADLRKANLRYITLEEADLQGAILENANLRDANLYNINLGGAYLSGADLSNAKLKGARLVNAYLQRQYNLNLNGADLNAADLSGADLRGARGLSQERIALTIGSNKATNYSKKTELPEGLNRPQWWSKGIEEQRRIVQELLLGH